MKDKDRIIYYLNFLWTSITAFSFPICFGIIFLDITGHSKGYSYNLGSEKDISVIFGFIELFLWSALSLPSYIYIVGKTAAKGKRCLFGTIAYYIALAVICIIFSGGVSAYLKAVFNIAL